MSNSSPIPRVSIGLPVYNGERYLASAITSILDESFTDLELVICDNASTDTTESICREFAARDHRVRYFRRAENAGAGANFTSTFRLSRGEFFRWHSHDDLADPRLDESLVQALDAHPEAVFAYSLPVVIDGDGNPISGINWEHGTPFASPDAGQRFGELVWRLRDSTSPAPTFLFGLGRRATIERTPLMGGFFRADDVFLASMALAGPWVRVEDGLFRYRLHNASGSIHVRQWNPEAMQREWDPRKHGKLQMHYSMHQMHVEYARQVMRTRSLSIPARASVVCSYAGALLARKARWRLAGGHGSSAPK